MTGLNVAPFHVLRPDEHAGDSDIDRHDDGRAVRVAMHLFDLETGHQLTTRQSSASMSVWLGAHGTLAPFGYGRLPSPGTG